MAKELEYSSGHIGAVCFSTEKSSESLKPSTTHSPRVFLGEKLLWLRQRILAFAQANGEHH